MLLRDLRLYRTLLRRLSVGELRALYERTRRDQPALARVIGEELEGRAPSNGVAGR